MPTSKPPALTYRPDPELRKRLQAYADREHRSLSAAITVLLIKALDDDDACLAIEEHRRWVKARQGT